MDRANEKMCLSRGLGLKAATAVYVQKRPLLKTFHSVNRYSFEKKDLCLRWRQKTQNATLRNASPYAIRQINSSLKYGITTHRHTHTPEGLQVFTFSAAGLF
jgi:hypothetical protein